MPTWVSDILKWLKDLVEYALLHVLKLLFDGLASVIEAMPVPSFIADAGSQLGAIPANVLYWVSWFQLDVGIPMILSAYLLRWILRRIPFIG